MLNVIIMIKNVCYILFLSFRMLASMDGFANFITSSIINHQCVIRTRCLSTHKHIQSILCQNAI
jgi:uncharacterized protein YebE (UPF0316 family)